MRISQNLDNIDSTNYKLKSNYSTYDSAFITKERKNHFASYSNIDISYVTEQENKKLDRHIKVKYNLENAMELELKKIEKNLGKTQYKEKRLIEKRKNIEELKVLYNK